MPAVAVMLGGALGVVVADAGVTAELDDEAEEVPTEFVAVAVKV